jgi:quercetin dioxygenase-like cupin family protein
MNVIRTRPQSMHLERYDLRARLAALRADTALEAHGRDALTLVRDPSATVLLIALKTGGTLPPHHAPGAITVLVLEGRVAFQADRRRFELGAHELVTLEAHAEHAVTALESSALLITICPQLETISAL